MKSQRVVHSVGRVVRVVTLVLAFIAGASMTGCAKSSQPVDVVVYGATPAGVLAAVAAAREGRSVVLVEPLPLVGGMMSGGMGFSDSFLMHRETMGGLFAEFHQRVEADYVKRGVTLPYQANDANGVAWAWEPHVAERVFEAMLEEARVSVLLREGLASVERQGTSLTTLCTSSGKRLAGRVFIDASYEGDLLAAAKVGYRVGREGRTDHGESLAGVRYPLAPVTGIGASSAARGVLPLINGADRPQAGEGDAKVMAYNFRPCLTDDPENRVPFARPADYDPARYALWRHLYRASPEYGLLQMPADRTPSWLEKSLPFDLYPLPGGKFDANNRANLVSLALPGASWAYPEADAGQRQVIADDHRSYTQGLLYFLTQDAAVPERIRSRMQQLGYCRDEFVEFGNFPPVLYVREARRMRGEYFMTQADLVEHRTKSDSIGVASFGVDSHIVQRIAVVDGFIDEGLISISETSVEGPLVEGIRVMLGIPYQVPYRSIVPKADECSNLLVPVALSASHVAFTSLRVEPTWMVLGQSAGIAASIAVEDRVPVQKLDIARLGQRLEARRQILKLP